MMEDKRIEKAVALFKEGLGESQNVGAPRTCSETPAWLTHKQVLFKEGRGESHIGPVNPLHIFLICDIMIQVIINKGFI